MRSRVACTSFGLAAILACTLAGCQTTAPSAVRPIGLDSLVSLDHVPLECNFVCLQHSSYDRTGGNDDGFDGHWTHIRRAENGNYVIFDAQGPGCIYRLWSAEPPDGYVKFYFDDEPTPRLQCNFKELFQDKVPPFAAPLTGLSSGGWYSYLPMPFAKHCVIQTEKPTGFLAIAYHEYPPGAAVTTFSPKLSPAEQAELAAIQAWYADPAKREAAAGMTLKWERLPADDREVTLADVGGPATIRGLHMKIKTEMPTKWADDPTLRKTVIRIYFDDDATPAIEAPVGDFFGTGFGDKTPTPQWKPEPLTYAAVPFGMTPEFYYFRLPMPFHRSARITLENGTGRELELGWAADVKPGPVPANALYLHVQWRELLTKQGEHVPILDTTGRGHFVGTLLSMQSAWWMLYLEGDEKIFVDGEETPSIHGTGTEDYFNCGWYFKDGPVSRPYHGLTVKRDPQSRISAYRMHVPDCVPFTKSIKVEIEHGESNNTPYTDYAVVAYWYQDSTRHARAEKLPPASALRFPGTVTHDPEGWMTIASLMPTMGVAEGLHADAEKVAVVPLAHFDPNFAGPPQLLLTSPKPGASLRWQVDCPRDDLYRVQLFALKGPQFGVAELFVDGQTTGQKFDLFQDAFSAGAELPTQPVRLAPGAAGSPGLPGAPGAHWIELRITDRNAKATGCGLSVSAYRCDAASAFPKEWNIVGSFPGGFGYGYATAYAPEKGVDLTATYKGAGGKDVAWFKRASNGLTWLHEDKHLQPTTDCVAYAQVYVSSPTERDVMALLSLDDGGKLFINGDFVWGMSGDNEWKLDQFAVPIHLKAGWNEVLLKVCQGGGAWGYSFRILDPQVELKYSAAKSD